jgi:hypothetical protein
MTARYTFASIADMATHFDRWAARSLEESQRQKTVKEARFHEGQSNAYRLVASILKDSAIDPSIAPEKEPVVSTG